MTIDIGLEDEIKSLEDEGFYDLMLHFMNNDSIIHSIKQAVVDEKVESLKETNLDDILHGWVYDQIVAEVSLDTVFSNLKQGKSLSDTQSKFLSMAFMAILKEREKYKEQIIEGRMDDVQPVREGGV